MQKGLRQFVRGFKELKEYLLLLKQVCCPCCGAVETLNRHSKLYGNDPANPGKQTQRGQRVLCSDRGQRGGCGKSFSVFLAQVLPRHTAAAHHLWALLRQLLKGGSVKAAVEKLRLPFALESCYQLLGRLRRRLDVLRCRLCERQEAPDSSHRDPLLQTVEHLRSVFKEAVCPVSEFQVVFEEAVMG